MIYDLIQARRSIRVYKDKPVNRELVEKVLAAAQWAPSGKNQQNWRFFVLTGTKRDAYLALSQKAWLQMKDLLEKRLKPSLYEFTERFFYTLGNAPVLIFAYCEPHPDENRQTSLGSVYMAVQNLLLAAQSEGLGTCPMGSPLRIESEVDAFLGVAGTGLKLVCGITLGWPDHEPPAATRQENRVTWIKD